jgi:hypothetical protein
MMADGFTALPPGKMRPRRFRWHDDRPERNPGITNFVTAVKTAYWNHTPLLLVTPQAANRTIGQGGFQEVEQMALFKDMVCYQEEVRDPQPRGGSAEPRHHECQAHVGAGPDQHAARLLHPCGRYRAAGRSWNSNGPRAAMTRSPRPRSSSPKPSSR